MIPPSLWFPFSTSVLQAGEALDEGRASVRAMQQAAREHGSPTWYALMTQSHARLLRDAGSLVEAESEARLAVEAAAESDGWMKALPTGTLVGVLLDRGQHAEAARAWDLLGLPEAMPDARPMTELLVTRARLRAAHGDAAGALDDLAQAAERLARFGPPSMNDQPARLRTALLEHATGATERARATCSRGAGDRRALGRARSDRVGAARRRRDRRRRRAAAGRGAAARRFAAARRARHGAHGRRCRAAPSPERAATRARCCATHSTWPAPAVRTGSPSARGEELAATGARVPARAAIGSRCAHALGAAHRADGGGGGVEQGDRAGAVPSVKTIEMHLGHTYRKLDIGSRRELTATFANEDAVR